MHAVASEPCPVAPLGSLYQPRSMGKASGFKQVSRSAVRGSSWQASAGVRDEKKIDKRSKLRALAPSMSYLGSWRLSRAQGELVASQYAQMICFCHFLALLSVVRARIRARVETMASYG